jgi:glycosyltransferase involved in cell wall biosynthesis
MISHPEQKKLRILHLHSEARFWGGVERILFDTATGLEQQGWPQALLYSGSDVDSAFSKGFSAVSNSPSILSNFKPDAVLLHKCSDEALIRKVSALYPTYCMVHDHDLVCLRKHKYFPIGHAVCLHAAGAACYAHLCCFGKSEPEDILPVTFNSVAKQQQLMHAHENIRRFIVGSRWMQHELEINGFNPDSIDIIAPVPSSIGKARPAPQSTSSELLFVGQIIRGKGVDLLLKALAKVPGQWHANIVGDGPQLPECRALATNLGLDDRVDFHGAVKHEKLESFYRDASFCIVPSRWPEPFGMVGIEAMARARAVIGFDVGGIPDWIEHEKTGLLVPAADINGLAHAISSLLSAPNRSLRMGRAAAASVQRHFRHDLYLQNIKRVFESVCDKELS